MDFSIEDLPNYDDITFTHPITGVEDHVECSICPNQNDLKVYFVYTDEEHYEVELICKDCILEEQSPDTYKLYYFSHEGFFYFKHYWIRCPICLTTPVRKIRDEEYNVISIPYCKKCHDDIQEHHSHQLNHDVSTHISSFI